MKRTLESVELKWYHINTLEKFYKSPARVTDYTDATGAHFEGCKFNSGWREQRFIKHPKTGRYKLVYNFTLEEVGYKFENI